MAVRETAKTKEASVKANKDGILYAAIADIEIEKGFNLRGDKVKADEELISSVKANGVVHPLHVRWKNKKKEALYLVDGARRFDAATKADLGSVPIVNHGFLPDKEALAISMTANENQKPLTKKQRIEGFKRLRRAGYTVVEIARIMAIDKRTVSEAIRVEEKATKEMKQAARKTTKEGGVSTRVAARASTLPPKEQKKIVKKVAGKSTQAGLREVRKTEMKLGKMHAGPKSRQETVQKSGYTLAPDVVERCKALEEAVERRRKNGSTKTLNTLYNAIMCLRGKMKVSDVFEWDNI